MFRIFMFFFVLFITNLNSKTYESWINLKNSTATRFPVEKNNNGAFIEFLLDWINGPTGFWSQELLDRGLDDICDGKLCKWNYVNYSDNIFLTEDMYNENGINAIKIRANGSKFIGIEQEIFYDDTTNLDIYVYAKTYINSSQLFIQILNLDNEILQENSFVVYDEYIKYEFQSDIFKGNNKLKIRFGTYNTSEIIIDEASVMPNNNVNGIRKEIYDIFAEWKPAILRYPGGWHVDLAINKLENAIGPIDKRKSPLKTSNTYQRMDFGYHEYFKFIESLNIEAHIVVNLENGSSIEAANIVEYLNGDINSVFGKKRVSNGHSKPYNVKYWEVGNEQWLDIKKYADSLITFNDKMKKIDNDISIIANGDIWQGAEYYYKLDSLVGNEFEIYGYHPIIGIDTNHINSGENKIKLGYLSFMNYYEEYINTIQNYNLKNNNKHFFANTEWSHFLKNLDIQYYDTTYYSSQFQTGLFNALMTSLSIRNSNFHKMCEKTAHIGSIQRKIIDNKRLIYKKPSIVTANMFSEHLGSEVIQIDNETSYIPEFSILGEHDIWVYDAPYVDFTITASDDTTFVYVINRHIEDSVKVYLNSNLNYSSNSAKVYTYYQESLEAVLTPENIHGFDPKESIVNISDSYIFPPHSFSILALPTNETLTFSKDEYFIINQIVNDGILKSNIKEKIYSTEIYNIVGERVVDFNVLNNSTFSVNVSDLKTGVYFIKIETSNQIYKSKFIKN